MEKQRGLFPLIKSLIIKYKQLILYGIFGVLTTAVNFVTYWLVEDLIFKGSLPYIALSTIIAWVIAVLFAYGTNKVWVFESKSFKANVLIREMISFFLARGLSGLLDLGIMYLFATVLQYNDLIVKIISNVLVIIINYILSKFWIFKKKTDDNKTEDNNTAQMQ